MAGPRLTPEQSAVVDARSPRVRVDAGAGTGKTSTLVAYAASRPRQRGLYLAFNKTVQVHASRVFPANCVASTLHSLAYAAWGRRYKVAGKLSSAVPHGQALALVPEANVVRRLLRMRLALAAVHEYVVSDASEVGLSASLVVEASRIGIPLASVMADARRFWSIMSDPADRRLPALHDTYFKQWAMSLAARDLSRFAYVLVDEAQDLNPVADAVLRQHAKTLVYVGDSAQGIYAFRGAADCLATMPAVETLRLTQSFRFGPGIAALANRLLSQFRGDALELTGVRGPDYVGPVQQDLPHAILCRTNAGVFSAAADWARRGARIHFIGGAAGYAGRVRDAYELSRGHVDRLADPVWRALGSIDALREYAEVVNDAELRSLCRVVEAHGDDIPAILKRFETCAVQKAVVASGPMESLYPADVFVGTCHRAKGLEFGQVRIGDDFPSLCDGERPLSADRVDPQEVNLLYVAMTRAALLLQLPPRLAWLSAQPPLTTPATALT